MSGTAGKAGPEWRDDASGDGGEPSMTTYWQCTEDGCDTIVYLDKGDDALDAIEHLHDVHGIGEIVRRREI